jgi:hypothetical protein
MRAITKFGPTFCVLAFLLVCSSARADWNPGDPYKMHYPQLPDLTPTGIDVLDTLQPPTTGQQWKILADDFKCTETGPISDVHIWGSWLSDQLPQGNPANVQFKLSIHADIPAPPTGGHSMPGTELWEQVFPPGAFTVRPYATSQETFFDPNINQIIGTDTTVWQYNFQQIPNPFVQQAGTIYWLDVQALVPAGTGTISTFGWKTTNPLDPRTPHFNDDAVYADTAGFDGPPITPWTPLVYPSGSPLAGQSMDLSFVITPEPIGVGMLAMASLMFLRRK